jgi:hypothetical protein
MINEGLDISETLDEARERSLEEDVRDLAGHAKTYARTEFAFQKTRVGLAATSALWIAVWGGAALVFLFFSIMALVVGAIVTLAPLITALGATLLVFALLAIGVAASGFLALRRWRSLTALFNEDPAA